MYELVRTVHLLLASFSLPFLLMYGISAVQMAHRGWFDLDPSTRDEWVELTPRQDDARAVARELMERRPRLRGELRDIERHDGHLHLRIVLPGTNHAVDYDPVSGRTRLTTATAPLMGMLNRLHHTAGLWHEPAALNRWGIAAGLVSVALLLVGTSGIVLWFLRRKERLVGGILLAVNLIVAMTLLGLMRVAGP